MCCDEMKFYKSVPTEDDRDSCVHFILIENFNTCYSYIWDIVIAYFLLTVSTWETVIV